jgi:hypothetical protein
VSTKDLFRITEGTAVYRFTSSNEIEVWNGDIYLPRVVGRTDVQDKATTTKNKLSVKFPLTDDLAIHFLKSPVDFAARLDLFSKDEDGEYDAEWRGALIAVTPNDKEIVLDFNNIFSGNRRVGARPTYSRSCRHAVYDPGCRLVFDDHKVAAHVTAISTDGFTMTIPEADSFADGALNAGVLVMPDNTMRYISNHVGSTITIIRPSPSLQEAFAAANPVDVFIAIGCNQATAWCNDVLNNIFNYGGFPNIPLTLPTGSSIV